MFHGIFSVALRYCKWNHCSKYYW